MQKKRFKNFCVFEKTIQKHCQFKNIIKTLLTKKNHKKMQIQFHEIFNVNATFN